MENWRQKARAKFTMVVPSGTGVWGMSAHIQTVLEVCLCSKRSAPSRSMPMQPKIPGNNNDHHNDADNCENIHVYASVASVP